MKPRRQLTQSAKVVRENLDSQFTWELFKITGKYPDDPSYEDINPYLRVWLFENWLFEKEREIEQKKDQAILIGSFTNPEAAQKMVKSENPDYASSDKDFDAATKLVRDQIKKDEKSKGKKGRRKVLR
jgi:hypothetical protein